MNGQARFPCAMLLVVMLTACATPAQILPTIFPNTELSKPIVSNAANFKNVLVYDSPQMYKVVVETVQYPTVSGSSMSLLMDVFYPAERQPSELQLSLEWALPPDYSTKICLGKERLYFSRRGS